MITFNNLHFAESNTDFKLHPERYDGVVRRYKNKLEIFDKTLSSMAVINQFGVLFGFSKDSDGNKKYRFLFHDDPLYVMFGGYSKFRDDLQKVCIRTKEQYIDTTKDGGMFAAFPNHEYRFG